MDNQYTDLNFRQFLNILFINFNIRSLLKLVFNRWYIVVITVLFALVYHLGSIYCG